MNERPPVKRLLGDARLLGDTAAVASSCMGVNACRRHTARQRRGKTEVRAVCHAMMEPENTRSSLVNYYKDDKGAEHGESVMSVLTEMLTEHCEIFTGMDPVRRGRSACDAETQKIASRRKSKKSCFVFTQYGKVAREKTTSSRKMLNHQKTV
jgi:hypothetical protein